jgi:hypothetical protein
MKPKVNTGIRQPHERISYAMKIKRTLLLVYMRPTPKNSCNIRTLLLTGWTTLFKHDEVPTHTISQLFALECKHICIIGTQMYGLHIQLAFVRSEL